MRAAPFRAHLWSVVGLTGVHWRVVALRAGVSPALVRHLLFGRDGRSVKRISHGSALRLSGLDHEDIMELHHRLVSAGPTVRRYERLRKQGHTASELAVVYQVDRAALESLPHATKCSALTELVVLAAVLDDPGIAEEVPAWAVR